MKTPILHDAHVQTWELAVLLAKVSEQQMHEMKREHVRNYVRSRNFLRTAVKMKLISADDARKIKREVIEQRSAWRLIRMELRDLWATARGGK